MILIQEFLNLERHSESHSQDSCCISLFSAAVTKWPAQKQLKEELVLAYSSRELENIMAGKAWLDHKNRNLAEHILSVHRK